MKEKQEGEEQFEMIISEKEAVEEEEGEGGGQKTRRCKMT